MDRFDLGNMGPTLTLSCVPDSREADRIVPCDAIQGFAGCDSCPNHGDVRRCQLRGIHPLAAHQSFWVKSRSVRVSSRPSLRMGAGPVSIPPCHTFGMARRERSFARRHQSIHRRASHVLRHRDPLKVIRSVVSLPTVQMVDLRPAIGRRADEGKRHESVHEETPRLPIAVNRRSQVPITGMAELQNAASVRPGARRIPANAPKVRDRVIGIPFNRSPLFVSIGINHDEHLLSGVSFGQGRSSVCAFVRPAHCSTKRPVLLGFGG